MGEAHVSTRRSRRSDVPNHDDKYSLWRGLDRRARQQPRNLTHNIRVCLVAPAELSSKLWRVHDGGSGVVLSRLA